MEEIFWKSNMEQICEFDVLSQPCLPRVTESLKCQCTESKAGRVAKSQGNPQKKTILLEIAGPLCVQEANNTKLSRCKNLLQDTLY